MSVKELMQVEVSSVARKEQTLARAAAAVYVITRDQIRRSGYRSVPELLRLAPGLHVAQAGAHTWTISARGFNGVFANKMLVLVDGRSIYTPQYAGVYWELNDLMVEDIERIEVIRGPGGTMWGANAVNGVINIITRSARSTQGGMLVTGAGTRERAFASLRYGGRFGRDAWYRVYGKYANQSSMLTASGDDAGDRWVDHRAGMRVDWDASAKDTVTILADGSRARFRETTLLPSMQAPFVEPHGVRYDTSTEDVLVRWRHTHVNGSETQVQFYYDGYDRPHPIFGERRKTVDAEFQNRSKVAKIHDLTWGGGYRLSADRAANTYIRVRPDTFGLNLFTVFAEDEVELKEDQIFLTFGAKMQHSEYSDAAVQPTARLLIEPVKNHVFWGSVSRAIRLPSRLERDAELWFSTLPGTPQTRGLSQKLFVHGSADNTDQAMMAYEAGYRTQPWRRLALDVTVFRHDYQRLKSMGIGQPALAAATQPYLSVPLTFGSGLQGMSWGPEILAQVDLTPRWKLLASYTGLDAHFWMRPAVTPSINAESFLHPNHLANIRTQLDLPGGVQADAGWYAVGAIKGSEGLDTPLKYERPGGWSRFDARVMWPIRSNLDLSFRMNNLFNDHHLEFPPEAFLQPAEIKRDANVTIEWRF